MYVGIVKTAGVGEAVRGAADAVRGRIGGFMDAVGDRVGGAADAVRGRIGGFADTLRGPGPRRTVDVADADFDRLWRNAGDGWKAREAEAVRARDAALEDYSRSYDRYADTYMAHLDAAEHGSPYAAFLRDEAERLHAPLAAKRRAWDEAGDAIEGVYRDALPDIQKMYDAEYGAAARRTRNARIATAAALGVPAAAGSAYYALKGD